MHTIEEGCLYKVIDNFAVFKKDAGYMVEKGTKIIVLKRDEEITHIFHETEGCGYVWSNSEIDKTSCWLTKRLELIC